MLDVSMQSKRNEEVNSPLSCSDTHSRSQRAEAVFFIVLVPDKK